MYEVELSIGWAQPTLVARFEVAPAALGARLHEVLPAIHRYATARGVAVVGPPFTRYLEMRAGTFVVEAGVPVAASTPGLGEIVSGELPGGPLATTWHVGP